MRLSDLIKASGYYCRVTEDLKRLPGALGEFSFDEMQARLYRTPSGRYGVAILEDDMGCMYSAAHEIAEGVYGFDHSADMFCMQANILYRWAQAIDDPSQLGVAGERVKGFTRQYRQEWENQTGTKKPPKSVRSTNAGSPAGSSELRTP